MKRALITGIAGQDGAYLSELLLSKGYHVTGTIRRNSLDELDRLRRIGVADKVEIITVELSDANSVTRIIREGKYDEIYNLAAQSFVGSSWDQPIYTSDVNAMGVVRLLDAIRTYCPEARFYQASTSEMFGRVRDIPQSEMTAFHPRSPYGVAKTFGHYMTMNYRESFDLHGSSGILFNHESPLRGPEFVTRKITLGLAQIANGNCNAIELGNMDAKRDWGFARDYVEGMWRMLQQDVADDYVLATGVTTSIRDFVNFAAQALDIELEWDGEAEKETATDKKTGNQIIRINPKFYRPAEVSLLIGDASKAEKALGWKAQTSIEELAAMMAKSDYDDAKAAS
ncbi:NAD-dependent epimerase/dehydratase [Sulfitobacter noctilucicola]|uniref:GDP-mannose 4,6-dehydratase n=1 Tax=Sulfitobacter noctilucicola TaxID=1342301 RepID=A0A7W6M9Y8_9RHOB|nr:GDP-mannose 4,6-dehydratase [Sulfitobacter noctilucicola]KIN63738.1 NAD-dependent epimerase/dehydratase [Sulfitobacter noctilucicola]MBB4174753.1 GDPmannose 4,6-dehydratase [Sulfitobacter noctilucicola]